MENKQTEQNKLHKILNAIFIGVFITIIIGYITYSYNYEAAKKFNKEHEEFNKSSILVEPTNSYDSKKDEHDVDEYNMRSKVKPAL